MKEKDKITDLQEDFKKIKEFKGAGHNINPIKPTAQTMGDKQYLEERLQDQINYFSSKASKARKKYLKLKRWEIFIAATIPVLIAFSALGVFEHTIFIRDSIIVDGKEIIKPVFSLSTVFQILSAIGGVIIVIMKGIVDLEDYHKTWKDYRALEMTLQQEKYKFMTRTEPYDEGDAYPLLVEQIEGELNKENQKWRSVKKYDNQFTRKIEEKMLADLDTKIEKD